MHAEYARAYARLYREHWWWRVREGLLLAQVARLPRRASAPARILDVGCGAGLFFDRLASFGDIQGVESDASIVEQSGKWRDRIHVGGLETFVPDRPFDLILLLDVLEHDPHPAELMRRVTELLDSRGRVLVTVPAFNWLWTSHDDFNAHLMRYTRSQLRALITRAGLRVIETRYLFQSLLVPKLAVRAKEWLHVRPPRVPSVPPRPVNAALAAWYRLEHAAAGRLPFGSSIMALAQR